MFATHPQGYTGRGETGSGTGAAASSRRVVRADRRRWQPARPAARVSRAAALAPAPDRVGVGQLGAHPHGERTVVEFPLAAGVAGVPRGPAASRPGALAALLTDCTVPVVRGEDPG